MSDQKTCMRFSLCIRTIISHTDCRSFDPPCQTACRELFYENYNTCVPADVMTMQEPLPALTNTLDQTIFFAPVDLSTTTNYVPFSDYTPHLSPSGNAIIASPTINGGTWRGYRARRYAGDRRAFRRSHHSGLSTKQIIAMGCHGFW